MVQCYLPWDNIWIALNPVEVMNKNLSMLVRRYIATKVRCVRNKDKPWLDDQYRNGFGLKQESHLRWTRYLSRVNWKEFVHCEVRVNETYS